MMNIIQYAFTLKQESSAGKLRVMIFLIQLNVSYN